MKTVSSCDRIKSSEALSRPRRNLQTAWILGVNLQNGFKHIKLNRDESTKSPSVTDFHVPELKLTSQISMQYI